MPIFSVISTSFSVLFLVIRLCKKYFCIVNTTMFGKLNSEGSVDGGGGFSLLLHKLFVWFFVCCILSKFYLS